jgi:hypothetical protein
LISADHENALYIDHSIIAREEHWPAIHKLADTGRIRVVVSQWNLFEIASGSDKKQALKRADFLDSLKLDLQRLELRAYVHRAFFKFDSEAPRPFAEYLSVVISYADRDGRALGYTARRWIETVDVSALQADKKLIPEALRNNASASPQERRKAMEKAFEQIIGELLPDSGPDGKLLTKEQKGQLLSFCLDSKAELLKQCPAIAAEYALCDIRSRDPSRNPKESDTADLLHSVVALPYCDYFLVGDGYVRNFSEQLAKELPQRIATILRRPEDVPPCKGSCKKK